MVILLWWQRLIIKKNKPINKQAKALIPVVQIFHEI